MILVEIYPDSADEYRWRAKDGENGRVIADSGEGYKTYVAAERMVERIFGAGAAEPPPSEPVRLDITYRSGAAETVVLR